MARSNMVRRLTVLLFVCCAIAVVAFASEDDGEGIQRQGRRLLPRKFRRPPLPSPPRAGMAGPANLNRLRMQRPGRMQRRKHRDNVMMETSVANPKVLPPPPPLREALEAPDANPVIPQPSAATAASLDPFSKAKNKKKRLRLNEKHLVKAQSRSQANLPQTSEEVRTNRVKGETSMLPLSDVADETVESMPVASRRSDPGLAASAAPVDLSAATNNPEARAGEGVRFLMKTLAYNLKNRGRPYGEAPSGQPPRPRRRLRPKRRRPGPGPPPPPPPPRQKRPGSPPPPASGSSPGSPRPTFQGSPRPGQQGSTRPGPGLPPLAPTRPGPPRSPSPSQSRPPLLPPNQQQQQQQLQRPKKHAFPGRNPPPLQPVKRQQDRSGSDEKAGDSYGAPQASVEEGYGAPQAPLVQEGYGAPKAPVVQDGYGAPQAAPVQESYGAPQAKPVSDGYSEPSPAAGDIYRPPPIKSQSSGYSAATAAAAAKKPLSHSPPPVRNQPYQQGEVIGYVPTAPRNNFGETIDDVVKPPKELNFGPFRRDLTVSSGGGKNNELKESDDPFKREVTVGKRPNESFNKDNKRDQFRPVFEPSRPISRPPARPSSSRSPPPSPPKQSLRPTIFPVYPGKEASSSPASPPPGPSPAAPPPPLPRSPPPRGSPAIEKPLAPVIRADYDYQYYDTDNRGTTIVKELVPEVAGGGGGVAKGERTFLFLMPDGDDGGKTE
jgi:hypothetical protein